jgi:hypothetical protein
MAEQIVVDCIAPIPVGHMVEVRVFKEPAKGFLSRRADAKYQVHHPWVRDLETKVEHRVYWQYSDSGMLSSHPGTQFLQSSALTSKP